MKLYFRVGYQHVEQVLREGLRPELALRYWKLVLGEAGEELFGEEEEEEGPKPILALSPCSPPAVAVGDVVSLELELDDDDPDLLDVMDYCGYYPYRGHIPPQRITGMRVLLRHPIDYAKIVANDGVEGLEKTIAYRPVNEVLQELRQRGKLGDGDDGSTD